VRSGGRNTLASLLVNQHSPTPLFFLFPPPPHKFLLFTFLPDAVLPLAPSASLYYLTLSFSSVKWICRTRRFKLYLWFTCSQAKCDT